ncbi:MAG: hypothetical protein HY904_19485 [Deltaproteobacteria bacterium]|nr:hypothetical protein [Deltaproteobacteria bacterium]
MGNMQGFVEEGFRHYSDAKEAVTRFEAYVQEQLVLVLTGFKHWASFAPDAHGEPKAYLWPDAGSGLYIGCWFPGKLGEKRVYVDVSVWWRPALGTVYTAELYTWQDKRIDFKSPDMLPEGVSVIDASDANVLVMKVGPALAMGEDLARLLRLRLECAPTPDKA